MPGAIFTCLGMTPKRTANTPTYVGKGIVSGQYYRTTLTTKCEENASCGHSSIESRFQSRLPYACAMIVRDLQCKYNV